MSELVGVDGIMRKVIKSMSKMVACVRVDGCTSGMVDSVGVNGGMSEMVGSVDGFY